MRTTLSLGTITLIASSAFGQQSAPSPQVPPKKLPQLEHFNATNVDTTADPCTDFYEYADRKWLAAHPIPPDQVDWGVGSQLQLWNETVLLQSLRQNSSDNPKRSPNEQRVGDFYFACMDVNAIDVHTAEWLKPELDRISGIKNKTGIAEEVAHLHQTIPGAWAEYDDNETNVVLFGFAGHADYDDASHNVASIDQGGMALPARSFYLDEDAKAKEIRAKYLKHIANIFVLSGQRPEQAKADAEVVLALETEMAKGAMDPVARRDPKNLNNKMSLAEVKALTPSFDWNLYLNLVKAPPSNPHYRVTSPEFFKGIEVLLTQHPLDHWKTYLRWWMLHGNATILSDVFVAEDFDFFHRTLWGAQELEPRWRRCVRDTDGNLGEALGQVYVERAFSSSSKQRVLQLVQDLEMALSKDIDAADWMTPETKQKAQLKLHATLNQIGYPEKWRDYSSVSIGRSSYLHNRQQTAAFEYHRWVNKIGTPVDRSEWFMSPPTVNAYENPHTITVTFPAGILQPPYFDPQQDDVVNYGEVGTVIGHEIIHGFDDEGRKFDAQGNLRDWWTESDAKAYEMRGKCFVDQYTEEIPEAGPGVKQDGRLTQGEDTADNGGVHLALLALQTALIRQGKSLSDKGPDGFTNLQRFFLSYAFSWCQAISARAHPHYSVNRHTLLSQVPPQQRGFQHARVQAGLRLS